MKEMLRIAKVGSHSIDEATIREGILKNTVPVTAWATVCLLRDGSVDVPIGELYGHYEGYCRREKYPPLPRKIWIATMKLAGFETQSGAFVGLAIQ